MQPSSVHIRLLDGVTREEDGYNYEMAYASEVSSTCEVKSQSGDFGGMETGEPDPVRWDRWPSGGPGGPGGLGSWGNRELLWGKVKDGKGLPCTLPFSSREWGGGTLESPGGRGLTALAWPPSTFLPRLPLGPGRQNVAYHPVGLGRD